MIKNSRKRRMNESYGVYDLINYFDVWGNEEDGWDVNDLSRDETDIWIDDDTTDEELVDFLIDEVGFLSPSARGKVEVWNDGDMIEFSVAETGEPLCRLERTRTAEGKAMGESRKTARMVSVRPKKFVKEDMDLDNAKDEYKMQLLQLIDMLDDLKEEISDLDYHVFSAGRINDRDFEYVFDNCKVSIENATTYLSCIRNALR